MTNARSIETNDIALSNRDKSREFRGRGAWCAPCDRAIVAEGSRCPHCGARSGSKRYKPGKTPL